MFSTGWGAKVWCKAQHQSSQSSKTQTCRRNAHKPEGWRAKRQGWWVQGVLLFTHISNTRLTFFLCGVAAVSLPRLPPPPLPPPPKPQKGVEEEYDTTPRVNNAATARAGAFLGHAAATGAHRRARGFFPLAFGCFCFSGPAHLLPRCGVARRVPGRGRGGRSFPRRARAFVFGRFGGLPRGGRRRAGRQRQRLRD